jgi:hypothetical protein
LKGTAKTVAFHGMMIDQKPHFAGHHSSAAASARLLLPLTPTLSPFRRRAGRGEGEELCTIDTKTRLRERRDRF